MSGIPLFLGTLLTDKYEVIQKNPSLIDKFSKGNTQLHNGLEEALVHFGKETPTRQELSQFLNAFQLKQYAAVGTSPFSHLSLGEWWSLFTKAEENTPKDVQVSIGEADLIPFQDRDYSVMTSSSTKQLPRTKHLINSIGSLFPSTEEVCDLPTFISIKTEKGQDQISTAMDTLMQQELNLSQDAEYLTRELTQEIALLQRELLKTSQKTPKDTCSLFELAEWSQEVSDKCYAVELLEDRIATLMSHARESLSSNDAELERYGKKHKNIILQARLIEGLKLPGLAVPIPHGIASDRTQEFLKKHAPEVFTERNLLKEYYASYQGKTPFLEDPKTKLHLKAITNAIKAAFQKAAGNEALFQELASSEFSSWLDAVRGNNDYLMVRSTGAEDSRQSANAGGNLSLSYVPATRQDFTKAAGEVLMSYFGFSSLQNQINAGINPFEQDLKLAVTAQQLIGEPVGGTKNSSEIPVSLVLFTSEPLYVGGEKFRTMRISATYGHGEGVVGGLGIGTDTALLLISEAHPDRLYVLYDNADKPERLVPVETPEGIKLMPVSNPQSLRRAPVLNQELLARLYTWGVVGEKFFNDHPTDMEIVIKNGTIYPVQARPINRPDLLPTYLDMKRVKALVETPILDKIQGEMLVPGKASVVVLKDPKNELNYAQSLEKAEKALRMDKHELVIVIDEEPSNSHPIVNFSGLGIPCLRIKENERMEKLKDQTTEKHPLVVDMQTGTVYQWDSSKGDVNESIVKGFAVHPAKIAISLPIDTKIKAAETKAEVPQEVKDLILAIGIAETRQAAQKSLEELKKHPFVGSLKEQSTALTKHTAIPKRAKDIVTILNTLDQTIDEAFEEVKAVLERAPDSAHLRPLIHVKVLENLLTGKYTGSNIAKFSRLTVEPLYAEAKTLVEYQQKFSHPVHFAEIYLAGNKALDPASQEQWRTF